MPLVPDFTWSASGLTVTFTDTTTGGPPDSWAWDFDWPSGTDSTVQNPVYTFPAAGSYTVFMTAAKTSGIFESESVSHTVIVSGAGTTTAVGKDVTLLWNVNSRLKCDFDFAPASGDAPLLVNFTDKSTPGANPIDGWSWKFEYPATDSGKTSTAQNPSHLYANYGYFTVLLTITAGPETAECVKTVLVVAGAGGTPQGAVPFAMGGSDVSSDSLPMVVQGSVTQTSAVELFLQNIDVTTRALPLFTDGASGPDASVPFVLVGASPADVSMPFVVTGFVPSLDNSLNLSLTGGPLPSAEGSVNFALTGSTYPTWSASVDLVMLADVGQVSGGLNLTVAAQPSETVTSPLNFSITCAYPSAASAVPFVLQSGAAVCPVSWDAWTDHWDSSAGVWGCDPSFGESFSIALAGSPVGNFTQSLNMFLERSPAEMIPFVLCGPGQPTEGSVTFVMWGSGSVQQGMDMVMPSTVAEHKTAIKLVTHGW